MFVILPAETTTNIPWIYIYQRETERKLKLGQIAMDFRFSAPETFKFSGVCTSKLLQTHDSTKIEVSSRQAHTFM